jgi:hypothetical protein
MMAFFKFVRAFYEVILLGRSEELENRTTRLIVLKLSRRSGGIR